jgi:hypothetical protein
LAIAIHETPCGQRLQGSKKKKFAANFPQNKIFFSAKDIFVDCENEKESLDSFRSIFSHCAKTFLRKF